MRDFHYHLGNGRVGVRPVPYALPRTAANLPTYHKPLDPLVEETVSVPGANGGPGADVHGAREMDSYLCGVSGLGPDEQIWAYLSYTHPEHWFQRLGPPANDLDQVIMLHKIQNGHTHLGVYIGQGRARNAPTDYQEMAITPKGYPSSLSTIELKGVPVRVTNANLRIVEEILDRARGGAVFPPEYAFDWYETVTLADHLAFYHAWLDPNWKRPAA